MTMRKNSFNPAAFTGAQEPETPPAVSETEEAEDMMNVNNGPAAMVATIRRPVGRPKSGGEVREKRCSFTVKPSVFKRLNALARIEGTSVSDMINELVEGLVFSDSAVGKLDKYKELWDETV